MADAAPIDPIEGTSRPSYNLRSKQTQVDNEPPMDRVELSDSDAAIGQQGEQGRREADLLTPDETIIQARDEDDADTSELDDVEADEYSYAGFRRRELTQLFQEKGFLINDCIADQAGRVERAIKAKYQAVINDAPEACATIDIETGRLIVPLGTDEQKRREESERIEEKQKLEEQRLREEESVREREQAHQSWLETRRRLVGQSTQPRVSFGFNDPSESPSKRRRPLYPSLEDEMSRSHHPRSRSLETAEREMRRQDKAITEAPGPSWLTTRGAPMLTRRIQSPDPEERPILATSTESLVDAPRERPTPGSHKRVHLNLTEEASRKTTDQQPQVQILATEQTHSQGSTPTRPRRSRKLTTADKDLTGITMAMFTQSERGRSQQQPTTPISRSAERTKLMTGATTPRRLPNPITGDCGQTAIDRPQWTLPMQPRTMVADSVIGPKMFSGTENASQSEEWLSYLERYTRYRNMTDREALDLASLLLRDLALDWFTGLPHESKTSFETFKEAFRQSYLPNEILRFHEAAEIFTTKQRDDETIDCFVSRIRKGARRIKLSEDTLFAAIVNGMKAHIRTHILQQGIQSLDELVKLARILEAYNKGTDPVTSILMDIKKVSTDAMSKQSQQIKALTDKLSSMTTPSSINAVRYEASATPVEEEDNSEMARRPASSPQRRQVRFQAPQSPPRQLKNTPRNRQRLNYQQEALQTRNNYFGQNQRPETEEGAFERRCRNCLMEHRGRQCPAANIHCYNCSRLGHTAKACLSAKRRPQY